MMPLKRSLEASRLIMSKQVCAAESKPLGLQSVLLFSGQFWHLLIGGGLVFCTAVCVGCRGYFIREERNGADLCCQRWNTFKWWRYRPSLWMLDLCGDILAGVRTCWKRPAWSLYVGHSRLAVLSNRTGPRAKTKEQGKQRNASLVRIWADSKWQLCYRVSFVKYSLLLLQQVGAVRPFHTVFCRLF